MNKTNNYVLNFLSKEDLNKIFDPYAKKTISYFIKKILLAQPEKKKEQKKELPIQAPKEHIEQWMVQALDGEHTGSGSYPIDIVFEADGEIIGADVKMLSCKTDKNGNLTDDDSGETSISQKFKDENFGENNTLDELFKSKEKKHIIWDKWKDLIKEKYSKVFEEKNVNKIYYIFLLRAGKNFYVGICHVNLDNIDNTEIDFEKTDKSENAKSLWIKNFINDRYGSVKVYKSKKRVELRLKPKSLEKDNHLLKISTDFELKEENIKEIIKDEKKFQEYVKEISKNFINLEDIKWV